MCGIAGLLLKKHLVTPEILEAFARSLAHRGPDATGIHCDGPLGLAHTRLSIIDLSGGDQPLFANHGRLALVANGEIYNHPELRLELEAQGADYQTHSDCESILTVYQRMGVEGLKRLNGMFAFALWDVDQGRLLLARDRLGIKPLYYARLPDRFIFASELKALLPQLPQTPQIRPQALADFLQNQFITGRETIFQGIERLLPGEALSIDRNLQITRQIYWQPQQAAPRRTHIPQAREEFNGLFRQVFKEHIRSDVPYGLFLSGGVDSAVLLAMLERWQDQPIQTFSVGFRDSRMQDELDSASQLAERFATRHERLELGADDLFERLVHTTWACDDLMRDYAALPLAALSETAARSLKVIFTGEGGDEVFAGYRRYRRTFEDRIKSLLRPGTGGFRTRGHWRGNYPRQVFSPPLQLCLAQTRTPFRQAYQNARPDWSVCAKRQYTDLVTALPDNLLVKADRITMAFGLEARVPMLDHRVVEFGLALPDWLKLHGHQGKWFLKHWAEQHLPKAHLFRPKRGFHVPIGEWLSGRFLSRLGQQLIANPAIREWFDPHGVDMLVREQRSKGSAARELYGLMQFAIWHRLFIDSPGSLPNSRENPLDWIGKA
ncbi:MAG: asparagine synthase (glutamine-hydrolyzing) [Gammaproteobacteria bacterium]|nr:asparagine synthase (glutamine-hydrolyzing) [Gammaproteobacteria bacterium]